VTQIQKVPSKDTFTKITVEDENQTFHHFQSMKKKKTITKTNFTFQSLFYRLETRPSPGAPGCLMTWWVGGVPGLPGLNAELTTHCTPPFLNEDS
jgi:hypothetical protein